jgi:hypothetical protein
MELNNYAAGTLQNVASFGKKNMVRPWPKSVKVRCKRSAASISTEDVQHPKDNAV